MKKLKLTILSLLVLLISIKTISKAADFSMPGKFVVKEQMLVLNGTGIRHKWVDLYAGGLYLKSKNQNAAQIIKADEPMNIKLNVISKLITNDRLEEAMRSEINRVTNGKIDPYKDRIEQLVTAFKDPIKKGDVFDLVYLPGAGLTVIKNHKIKTVVKGLDFKQIIFDTWLGNDPADESLKNGMLGKSK